MRIPSLKSVLNAGTTIDCGLKAVIKHGRQDKKFILEFISVGEKNCKMRAGGEVIGNGNERRKNKRCHLRVTKASRF